MHNQALHQVCHRFGGQSNLARKLMVSPSRVNKWLNQGIRIPYEYAIAIEHMTNGEITCQMLLPFCKTVLPSSLQVGERLSWLESQVKTLAERLKESTLSCRHLENENRESMK